MNVLRNEQMSFLDSQTIEKFGIPGILLMERASLAVFETGMKMIKRMKLERVIIFCGPGNNGGDGLAAARHFDAAGIPVTIFLLAQPDSLQGDALANFKMLEKRRIQLYTDLTFLESWDQTDSRNVLLVDALFGTGLERKLEGPYEKAVDWMNKQAFPILAVDIPSGIHGNTGQVLGKAVRATETVTFHSPKIGNVSYPGAALNGLLTVVSIGIPAELAASVSPAARIMTGNDMVELLPERPVDAHKGTFGTLLILGGVEGYTGAGILAARAAERCGAGLVKTAVKRSLNTVYESLLPEAVTLSIEETASGFSESGLKRLRHEWTNASAVIAGPGWGNDPSWVPLLRELIHTCANPLLLDADALNLLAPHLHWLQEREGPVVITPHPGEMARLTGLSVEAINNNRLATAVSAAQDWQAVIVLKGAGTIIASPEGRAVINPTGNPGMAKAGSGDVLAGVIGALLAQGMGDFEAAAVGCFLHGTAGDLGANRMGQAGLTVGDMIAALPETFMCFSKKGGGVG